MPSERPRPGIRLTDAEREHAVDRLHRAHHDGRISLAEFDERVALVYRAQVAGDLEQPLAGVPTDAEARLLGGDEWHEVQAGSEGLTLSGRWRVPRRLCVRQLDAGGAVELDFTSAEIATVRVDVELRLGLYGSARMIVPVGATADASLLRGGGRPRRPAVPAEGGTGRLHLVVSGVVPKLRDVRIHHPGARRWLRFS